MSGLGQPYGQRQMQECVVGARAAESAGQHQAASRRARAPRRPPVRRRSCPSRRKSLPRHGGQFGRQIRPARNRNRRPTVQARGRASRVAHAGIGGDDARAGDLGVEPRRADEFAAKQDGECAHGGGLYQGGTAETEGAGARCQQTCACVACGRAYVSTRSNGVPAAIFADRLRGKSRQPAEPDPVCTGGGIRRFGQPRLNSFQLERRRRRCARFCPVLSQPWSRCRCLAGRRRRRTSSPSTPMRASPPNGVPARR